MLELLERRLTGNLLRYQVGQQMWCRGCDNLLDVQNTVSLDLLREGELLSTTAYCGDCWDRARAVARAKARRLGCVLEVTDGRTADPDDVPCDPRPCVRLGARGPFFTRKPKRVAVRGVAVTFHGDEVPALVRQQRWFAYRNPQGGWWVVHEGLGLAAARGHCLSGALARAIGSFRRTNEARLAASFHA
jgi:hypothetical protein